MPSKRPSASAMDEAAAARLHPSSSSPHSRKRSSRSKSRARDRRSPNPSARRDRGPEPRGHASGSAPSRKSDRTPKPRSFPDSATLATAMVSASASAAAASSSAGGGAAQKLWSDADEVALLTGAVAFKERTGIAPRLPDMADLFEYLRDSIAPHLDQAKVYYKLKRLKSKFQHSAPGATGSAHELLVRDLSGDLWGAELARAADDGADVEIARPVQGEPNEEPNEEYIGGDSDVPVRLPIVKEVLGEYWRLNGQALSGVSLEKGLGLLGPEEASVAEGKWRRQLEADMRMQMRQHDLGKEVYGLLIDAIKGLGP